MNKSKGIYEIKNNITQKVYIGSTTTTFNKRFNQHLHLLRKNKHHCNYLQNAWNKYGENSFTFNILEKMNNSSMEDIIAMEQIYIDYHLENNIEIYNMSFVAGLAKSHTNFYDIFKVNCTNGNIEDTISIKQLINNYSREDRIVISKLSINKLHIRRKGFYYIKKDYYDEWKLNVFNNETKVCVYNLKGELLNFFYDLKDCHKYYEHIKYYSISGTLTENNKNKLPLSRSNGYIFIRIKFKDISHKIKTGIKFTEVYTKENKFIEEFLLDTVCAKKYDLQRQLLQTYAKCEKLYEPKNVIFKRKIY